jgi:aspartyl-tRNA(Asn)/glutamyl-tRNA(Gln) amidotransferase subunit C
MALTPEDVRKVAHLARLALAPEDETRYARQLGSILEYIERLGALDLTGVEPMTHAVPVAGPERADIVTPSLSQAAALANAPVRVGPGVAVPKIIAEE